MSTEEATKHLEKLLKSQQIETSNAATNFIKHLSKENLNEKRAAANRLVDELDSLKKLAPKSKAPAWLDELKAILVAYVNSQLDSEKVATQFIQTLPDIRNHQWTLETNPPSGFDFEEIFYQCRAESRIPQLFDEIIELLEKIRDSGELDSRSMVDGLSKIIATLEAGKTSTRFNFDGAWKFLCIFLENYFWAEATNIPGIGPLLHALRETFNTAEDEIVKLRNNINQSVEERAVSEVRLFQRSSAPQLAIYSASGLLIEDRGDSGQVIQA